MANDRLAALLLRIGVLQSEIAALRDAADRSPATRHLSIAITHLEDAVHRLRDYAEAQPATNLSDV